MNDRPTLFSMPISHYCVSVERMLAFKGIEYDTVHVPYHDRQELIRVTAQDYVPALVWDGSVVPWQEIPEFLEKKRPTPTLFPKGSRGLATVLEHWGHLVLEERVWRAIVTKVPPVLHDDQERWVFEEMQTRARGPWSVLEMRQNEFRRDMQQHLRMIDTMLEGREWILSQPSIADFGISGGLSPFLTVGETIPADFPNLARWVDRIARLHGAEPERRGPQRRDGRKAGL